MNCNIYCIFCWIVSIVAAKVAISFNENFKKWFNGFHDGFPNSVILTGFILLAPITLPLASFFGFIGGSMYLVYKILSTDIKNPFAKKKELL